MSSHPSEDDHDVTRSLEEADGDGEGARTRRTGKGKEGAKARRGSVEHDRALQRRRGGTHGDGNVGVGDVEGCGEEGVTGVAVRL